MADDGRDTETPGNQNLAETISTFIYGIEIRILTLEEMNAILDDISSRDIPKDNLFGEYTPQRITHIGSDYIFSERYFIPKQEIIEPTTHTYEQSEHNYLKDVSILFEPLNPKTRGLDTWLIEIIDAAEKADKFRHYDIQGPNVLGYYRTQGEYNCTIKIPIDPLTEIKEVLNELEKITPDYEKIYEGISIVYNQPYIVIDDVRIGHNKLKGHDIIEVNIHSGYQKMMDLDEAMPKLCDFANNVGTVLKDMGYLRNAEVESYIKNN